jgi:hypothetical protein
MSYSRSAYFNGALLMLFVDRWPFDRFFRDDLRTETFIIVDRRGEIGCHAGAFFGISQFEPILTYLDARWPGKGFVIRPYRSSWAESLFDYSFFQDGWCDFRWLVEAASKNNVVCQRLLGFLYANQWLPESSAIQETGFTSSKRDQKSLHWFDRAIKNGDEHSAVLKARFLTLLDQERQIGWRAEHLIYRLE